jgi:hypothetical protein
MLPHHPHNQQQEFENDTAWFKRHPNRRYRIRQATSDDAFYERYRSSNPAIEKWLALWRHGTWRVFTLVQGGGSEQATGAASGGRR